jgi:hypothetical protein
LIGHGFLDKLNHYRKVHYIVSPIHNQAVRTVECLGAYSSFC